MVAVIWQKLMHSLFFLQTGLTELWPPEGVRLLQVMLQSQDGQNGSGRDIWNKPPHIQRCKEESSLQLQRDVVFDNYGLS